MDFDSRNVTCSDLSCTSTINLKNSFQEKCNFTITCPILEGNVCGDFGFSMILYDDNEENATLGGDICYEKEWTQIELDRDATVSLKFWHYQNARFNGSCYIWCTEAGDIPRKPVEDSFANAELIADLVGQ